MPVIAVFGAVPIELIRTESGFLTVAVGIGCGGCKAGVSVRVPFRKVPKQEQQI